ncbi:MAG: hypothetical protein HC786_08100 [Richelia sp. CSU_2_1]|nr:hypothetical protein [Richelia sp. CSU_2_1]
MPDAGWRSEERRGRPDTFPRFDRDRTKYDFSMFAFATENQLCFARTAIGCWSHNSCTAHSLHKR